MRRHRLSFEPIDLDLVPRLSFQPNADPDPAPRRMIFRLNDRVWEAIVRIREREALMSLSEAVRRAILFYDEARREHDALTP